jgi:HD-GYP domain-containing protein (c-di-GMP phosphodiesterase class II)
VSLGGRIVGAADVIDALTSPRAYRAAMPLGKAFEHMRSGGAAILCPVVAPALERLVRTNRIPTFHAVS